eukprot:jgi/Ulvmu1/3264/UM151_0012.1
MVGISSVWDVVPDDGDLYREVFQEHFGNTNLQVIAVFKTLKVDGQDKPSVTSDGPTANRGRAVINPELSAAACESLRILVLTVDKTIAPPKSKPALHKFGISFTSGQLMYHRRGNPLNLSVLKSIHLVDPPASSTSKAASANSILGAATMTNVLAAVWAAKPRTKSVPAQLPEGFVQPTANTTPFHYAFATGSQRIACACCLFCVARAFAGHKPALFGIDRSLINAWAVRTAAERPSNVVPSALERVAFGQGVAGGADGTEWAVLSERDEAHLTGLLQLINQTGKIEVGALRARLEAEHTAHEAANVQAILGSAAAVPRVIQAITGAGERLGDLELTLDMFDGKLASMREDIGSIEARNNSLETQARNLERLRASTTELLHTLSAPKEVAALDTMQLSDDNVTAAISGVVALKRKLESFTGDSTDARALRREVMEMRAVNEFKAQLQAVSAGFLGRASKHLCSVVRNMDPFVYKPRVALVLQPAVLPYAPLLHVLRTLPGGDATLKDVRHECTSAVASALAMMMNTCCSDTERRISASHDTSERGAAYKPLAQLLQDVLPPITHALLLVADALAMRAPADVARRSSDSEPARAPRPSIVDVSLSQRGSRAPTVALDQLLQPRAPLDSHPAALLGQVTAGSVREPLRRLVRAAGAKGYVPLVPLFAVIAGWRKHLSQFPAAAALNAELKEVLLEVTAQLERHQDVLVAAAEKQEQPRGAFTNDGKGVKALGVLPQTEALAAAAADLSAILKSGIPAQRWWMPWGEEEEIARSESLARKALEPIGRIVPAVYNAVLASLSKLAAGDAKHGPRLTLENLAALQPPLDALAALAPDVKAPAADLAGALGRSRDKVVEEQLQASKLWPLLSFAGRLHVLLREVAPTEVQYQQGFSQATVASTVESGYAGIDKKIAAISQRVKKHLSSNPHLLKLVWVAVEESMRKALTQLDGDLAACYDGVQPTMTWLGVEALIKQNTP